MKDLRFKEVTRAEYYKRIVLRDCIIINDNDLMYKNRIFRTEQIEGVEGDVYIDLKHAEIEDTRFYISI